MLVPAIIQPHLIPFIYEEFSGEGNYYDTAGQSKDVMLSRTGSLSQIIFRVFDNSKILKLYIKIQVVPGTMRSHSYAYVSTDNVAPAMLPAGDVKMINDILEDIMRTALVFFILGNIASDEDANKVQSSIEAFMERYNLYDFEFNVQQLRQIYYRSTKRNAILFRFQKQPATNRISSLVHVTGAGTIT